MANNILQLLGMVVVFVLILAATYYVTKWIARSGAIQPSSKNIKVIETFKIAPNKYIQIIRLGSRYYSIGVTKEHITFLSALDEEQLNLQELDAALPNTTFMDVMSKVASRVKKKEDKK